MQVSFGVSVERLQGPLEYQNLQMLRYPVEKGIKSVFTPMPILLYGLI